mmetsp:Transcript_19558/g.30625  ORF Transcript_19558/g.30625 Transcript_19558/m.30625 type:complete len:251 (-) Transcript_19558:74-826(-)
MMGAARRVPQNRLGTALLASSWTALLILLVTYLALRPKGPGDDELLQKVQKGAKTAGLVAQAGTVKRSHGKQAKALAVKKGHKLLRLAECECPFGDNPLAEIDEVNVFPGPSEFGPDSPTAVGPDGYGGQNSDCCPGGNAFGAPALSFDEMHKVFEIGEPNYKEWKEYKKPNNVFPGIVDWDPDSPNRAGSDYETQPLFDGHGGIVGLEDSDGWETTPGSVASRDFGEYADGSDGKDYNVFANGYEFPAY